MRRCTASMPSSCASRSSSFISLRLLYISPRRAPDVIVTASSNVNQGFHCIATPSVSLTHIEDPLSTLFVTHRLHVVYCVSPSFSPHSPFHIHASLRFPCCYMIYSRFLRSYTYHLDLNAAVHSILLGFMLSSCNRHSPPLAIPAP